MTSTSWDGNSEGVGALKQKCPPWGGGVWISSGTTPCILRYFPGGGGLCTSSPRSSGGGVKKAPLLQHPGELARRLPGGGGYCHIQDIIGICHCEGYIKLFSMR